MSAMGGGLVLAVGGVVAVISIWVVVALAARRAVHADDPPEGAPAPDTAPPKPDETGT